MIPSATISLKLAKWRSENVPRSEIPPSSSISFSSPDNDPSEQFETTTSSMFSTSGAVQLQKPVVAKAEPSVPLGSDKVEYVTSSVSSKNYKPLENKKPSEAPPSKVVPDPDMSYLKAVSLQIGRSATSEVDRFVTTFQSSFVPPSGAGPERVTDPIAKQSSLSLAQPGPDGGRPRLAASASSPLSAHYEPLANARRPLKPCYSLGLPAPEALQRLRTTDPSQLPAAGGGLPGSRDKWGSSVSFGEPSLLNPSDIFKTVARMSFSK